MSEPCRICRNQHPDISCLQSLRQATAVLEQKIISQHQKLEAYSEESKSFTSIIPNQDTHKHLVHQQACCDGCYQLPLLGTRFKCSKCPNFDLCFSCRYTFPHKHEEFYAITTANQHKTKNCTSCFGRITDVIHKCKICPSELCHECYVVNGHDHDIVEPVFPFDIKIEAYCNKNCSRVKNGDEILIQFIIYNLSKQPVWSLNVVDEDCPFIAIRRETKVNIYERDIAVIDVSGVIKAQARAYNTKFQIIETTLNEQIGQDVYIKFSVTEGLFSSLFKSS